MSVEVMERSPGYWRVAFTEDFDERIPDGYDDLVAMGGWGEQVCEFTCEMCAHRFGMACRNRDWHDQAWAHYNGSHLDAIRAMDVEEWKRISQEHCWGNPYCWRSDAWWPCDHEVAA